jgi:hypothetical protein
MILQRLMEYTYNVRHERSELMAKLHHRYEPAGDEHGFELFLSGMKRQEYEESNRAYEVRGDLRCRLCWSEDSIIYQDHLAITADWIPFFPYHMLMRPLREDAVIGGLVVGKDIKLMHVDVEQLDCRHYFTARDLEVMANLVLETDYLATQAMRGSGASVPEHVHSHAFKKTETDFPLLNIRHFELLRQRDDTLAFVMRKPSYAVLIQGDSAFIGEVFEKLRDHFGYPSNHIITVDETFGGLIGVYVPRVREVPEDEVFTGWKFGVFEVLGLFDVKTERQYAELKYPDLWEAIQNVTLHEPRIQAEVEKYVMSCIE